MPPFGTDPVPAVLAAPIAIALLLGMSLAGYRLVPMRLHPRRAELRIPLAGSVGVTAVGWVTWVVGALIGTTAALVVAGLLMASGLTVARAWFRDLRTVCRHLAALIRCHPVITLFGFGTVALAVPHLLLPVVDSDGLRYHLALAKLYLLDGEISFYPWDVHAAFPQTIEAVYMLGLGVAGGEVAKFLHFGAFLGSLVVLMLFVHRGPSTRRAAVCAPWFFAASPAVLTAAGAAFVDLFVVFHVAVAALLARSRAHPVLVGLALAGAASTKWSAAPAVAGIALLLWWRSRFRWRTFAAIALPIILAVLPYMVRNLVATGDPVFPMGVGLVKGHVPGIEEDRHVYVTQIHRDIPGPLGIPWGASVAEVQGDEVAGWHLLLGLLALPLLIRRPGGTELLAIAVPYLAVGLAYHPSVRLAMPLLWALAASSAWVVARVCGRFTAPVGLLLVLPALITSWANLGSHGRPMDVLTGRVTVEEALQSAVPGRAAALLVNEQPGGGKVMALDFPAPYFFSRPWIVEGINNRPALYQWLEAGDDPGTILGRLQQHEVRYLVITPGYGGGSPFSLVAVGETPGQRAVMAQLRSRLELIGTVDSVDVYRVPGSGQ